MVWILYCSNLREVHFLCGSSLNSVLNTCSSARLIHSSSPVAIVPSSKLTSKSNTKLFLFRINVFYREYKDYMGLCHTIWELTVYMLQLLSDVKALADLNFVFIYSISQ